MLYILTFKIIKMDRVFVVIYKVMSYTVISEFNYEILFMFLLKLNKFIYTLCTVHTNVVLKFDTSYIISAYLLYRSISLYSTTLQDRFIKYVKWKLSVTQLQPFATSKFLSLRFNLMIA